MNIESLVNKIEIFNELVIDSGFQRDVVDFQQSISQPQNQNLIFMKDISEKVITGLQLFENNSLDSELSAVLRDSDPFTSLQTISELNDINGDTEIEAQPYFQKLNSSLQKLHASISSNESELGTLRETFDKYLTASDEYSSDGEQAVMSLVFKDLESTKSLKEFARVVNRWNRTLLIYHTLLKSESPQEISLVEIQNGSIDIVFNIDLDVAIDLTDLIKTGLRVYGAYLLYKSKTAKEIITSYMGNKKLIATEKEREKLIHHWEDVGIRVEKARWGRFNVLKGKIKVELPKTTDIEKITKEEAVKMIEAKTPKKKKKAAKKK